MYIHLPNRTWLFSEIRQHDHFNGEFADALYFCHQWLNGTESFTLNTSGSTGKPKAIRVSREQMVASARGTISALGLDTGSHALICLNTGFIAGKMMLVRAMVGGFSATVVPPSGQVGHALKTSKATFTALVPMQVQQLLATGTPNPFHSLQQLLIGGAPLLPGMEQQLQKQETPHCFHTYGMTETVSHVALRKLNGGQAADCFTALEGVRFSTDARGCLVIDSPTAAERPLQTNDRVELRNERQFRWLGRADFVINSGGIKIQAETVEMAAGTFLHDMNRQYRLAALPSPHHVLGEKLVLAIESAPWPQERLEELHQQLKKNLPTFHAPKAYAFAPSFPETATAKVDRRILCQWLLTNKLQYFTAPVG